MKLYLLLNKLLPKASYVTKFLVIAFLGIHLPLIGFLVYFLLTSSSFPLSIFIVILVGTLVGTAGTLFLIRSLLSPFSYMYKVLDNYQRNRVLAENSIKSNDEAGKLIEKVHFTLTELDNSYKTKNDLIALLSHDLRSPFNKLISIYELQGSLDKEEREIVWDDIYEMSANQLKLLEDILSLMKLENNLVIEKEKVMISSIFEELKTEYTLTAKLKGVRLHFKNETTEEVLLNKTMFKQVLANLLSNSIKFSSMNQQVTIEAHSTTDEIRFTVTDEGLGMNEDNLQHLFKKFNSKGSLGTAGEKSTGLGLYLAQLIVHLHQGEIAAKSEGLNKGCSFQVTIPKLAKISA